VFSTSVTAKVPSSSQLPTLEMCLLRGPQYGRETNYPRIYMKQLRDKLKGDPSQPRFLRTEAVIGYRFSGGGIKRLNTPVPTGIVRIKAFLHTVRIAAPY
jgi:hypothetical protein